jgi:peptide/nickel transport system permease protein
VVRLTGRRLLVAVPLLIIVSLAMFVMIRLVPGDPAATLAGDQATPEGIAEIREQLGLNEPIHEQYVHWVADAVRGDLGTSLFNNQPVATSIKDRLPPTLSLALVAASLALVAGLVAGVASARRPGSVVDRGTTVFTSVGLAIPTFWLGLLLIVVFTYKLHWLPPTGYSPLSEGVGDWAKNIAMPAIALGIPSASVVARQTRSALLDVLERDFVRAARARGASKLGVLLKHGLKNAAAPIVTVFGIELIGMVGWTFVVEAVFNVPGVGNLAITAVQTRDFPRIQGLVVIVGLFIVVANLVVDLLYGWVNPRGRTT